MGGLGALSLGTPGLVAARVGPHVLVRVVARQGAVLSLAATNGHAREMFLGPSDDFAVLGVVSAIFRTWHDAPGSDEAP